MKREELETFMTLLYDNKNNEIKEFLNTKQEILCRMNPFPTEKNEDVVRRELMNAQQHCMGEYLHLLELRAELDGIKL